jgi:hypothetical protein
MGEGLEERRGRTDIKGQSVGKQIVVDSISNAAAWIAEKTIGIVRDERAGQTVKEIQHPNLGLHLGQGWNSTC